MMPKKFLISLILVFGFFTLVPARETIDLSGEWTYRLKNAPASISGEGVISLPNTLDVAHKSIYNPESESIAGLRREFSFVGSAEYSRLIEIPEEWAGKDITLTLERTKPAVVRVDGKYAGENSRISSPNRYKLSKFLSPGLHEIMIEVNNSDSIPPIVAHSSNATSESTQTNWNGITGDIFLEARNPFHIERVMIDDNEAPRNVKLTLLFSQIAPSGHSVTLIDDGKILAQETIEEGKNNKEISFEIESDKLWSASNPVLRELTFVIRDENGREADSCSLLSGFRTFSSKGKTFRVNGKPEFLRGTVNAAIFPLTAYAPTDIKSWEKYFSRLKEFGVNHVRFHSWTPPEAAFTAADRIGIYILTELPVWGELDRDLEFQNRFLKEELEGLMESYSYHPSFVMFSPGNELFGDLSLMEEYMQEAKDLNPRILSTYGTNVYLGMNGQIGEEDFIISTKTGDIAEKMVRGSSSFAERSDGGYLNSHYPGNNFNYNEYLKGLEVPLISHEVGQYQSYPDFEGIEKYTGNLKPDNLKAFRKRADESGLLGKNRQYAEASGKWASKLYKAEMEAALRTPGMGGFQLFGLQDYPGQGGAFIGILDAFMDDKGFLTPREWRESADEVTLIAEFPRYTFTSGETIEIPVMTVDYSNQSVPVPLLYWETETSEGTISLERKDEIYSRGTVTLKIPEIKTPARMSFRLFTPEREYGNEYDFWVYPQLKETSGKEKICRSIDEALRLLEKGEDVILFPETSLIKDTSVEGLFTTDFWNYRMYRGLSEEMNMPVSPGTLGLLINYMHPVFKYFPTANHTDWQWYPIVKSSRPLIIDRLPADYDPIVEVIDNVDRAYRMAMMMEFNVGKGKLLVVSVDPKTLEDYPEGKWFLQSIKEYVSGKKFKPALTLTPGQLKDLLTRPSYSRRLKELSASGGD